MIPEKIRKPIYSCFIITNLFVIVYCNLPHSVGDGVASDLRLFQGQANTEMTQSRTPHEYAVAYTKWHGLTFVQQTSALLDYYLRRYAHFVGLNNRWQMFGYQSRFNWWYIIKARYSDGTRQEEVVLDLPRQSEFSGVQRTWWQYHFFDFREGKFYLNLYREPYHRAAYARYLARKFPTHDGLPIESVAIELHYQNIRPPDEARASEEHLYPEPYHFLYNRFSAKGELEPERTEYSLPDLKAESTYTGADGHSREPETDDH